MLKDAQDHALSGATAEAVGRATTSAVVIGITSIVAADGIFAVLCNILNW